uniref:Uncharacterized protein n=1 Tax=Amphimedon queenslandica TaxID=400682 RepID=A0A1X7U5I6_AMPQE
RKRKVATNKPPKGKKRSKGRTAADPKFVKPRQRMLEYPHECFKVYSNSLFFDACREPLSLKKSVIESHMKSKKHRNEKEQLASKEKREKAIDDMLQRCDGNVHPVCESLPSTVRIF